MYTIELLSNNCITTRGVVFTPWDVEGIEAHKTSQLLTMVLILNRFQGQIYNYKYGNSHFLWWNANPQLWFVHLYPRPCPQCGNSFFQENHIETLQILNVPYLSPWCTISLPNPFFPYKYRIVQQILVQLEGRTSLI